MPKTDPSRQLPGYAPVAERITLFYALHPAGRIVTELVSRTEREVLFRALVYRSAGDEHPAATGWAAEREGDGDVNAVACLENTETSAIGRALANLGFTASRERASAEEIAKASRARARLAVGGGEARHTLSPGTGPVARAAEEPSTPAPNEHAPLVNDLLRLIALAEGAGLRRARAEAWRRALGGPAQPPTTLVRCERRLRGWLLRRLS